MTPPTNHRRGRYALPEQISKHRTSWSRQCRVPMHPHMGVCTGRAGTRKGPIGPGANWLRAVAVCAACVLIKKQPGNPVIVGFEYSCTNAHLGSTPRMLYVVVTTSLHFGNGIVRRWFSNFTCLNSTLKSSWKGKVVSSSSWICPQAYFRTEYIYYITNGKYEDADVTT